MPPHPEVWAAARGEILSSEVARAELQSLMAMRFGPPVDAAVSVVNDARFYDTPGQPAGIALAPPQSASACPPTTGKKSALVLLIDFDDCPGRVPKQHFEELLFASGTPASAPSMRDFYSAASANQLDIDGEVVGWLRMPHSLDYYVNHASGMGAYPQNTQKLCDDAIAAALKAGVKMSAFDADADGYLDGLVLVHAGTGAEVETVKSKADEKIWSHQSHLVSSQTHDGVTLYSFTIQPSDGKVGVFCHEFGHFLGLPDLYDTRGRSAGVGDWCVMGSGAWGGNGTQPVGFCAWARAELGWVTPTPITGNKQPLMLTATSRAVARLNLKHATKEYFLLESRVTTGIDARLPGEGLLIWHIDEVVRNNSSPPRYRVALEQADGDLDLEYSANRGDGADVFPGPTGNTAFNDGSIPNSRTNYKNRASGVDLTAITWANGVATATVTA